MTQFVKHPQKTVLSNLYESDIMNYFISGACDYPKLVLEKLLSLSSPYYPVHFFINQCKWSVTDAIEFIDSSAIKNRNSKVADKIRERITTDYSYGKNGVILLDITETLKEGACPLVHVTTVAEKHGLGKTMHQKIVRFLRQIHTRPNSSFHNSSTTTSHLLLIYLVLISSFHDGCLENIW